jgi:hypothetical protein
LAAIVVAAFGSSAAAGGAALVGALAAGIVLYIVASMTEGIAAEFFRSLLVGSNAAGNAAVWGIVGLWPVAAAVLVLNALAASVSLSRSEGFQGVLGWSNWLLPMSWLIVGLGAIFVVLSGAGTAVTLGRVEFFRLSRLFVDWPTGTIFLKGGWIANLNSYDTAFNMGNFAFIDKASSSDHVDHEAGHTLNLAAFGSWFHLIGFVDEVVLRRGNDALSEKLAQSNAGSSSATIPMWI